MAGGGEACERAQAFHHFRAAAELNDFSLREKYGFAQSSQKAPGNDGKLERRPDCSQASPPPAIPGIVLGSYFFDYS
jgi:hypothetical protein